MTLILDRDAHDVATWQINGIIPPNATVRVELSGAWRDLNVDGNQASILVAGPEYDPAVIGGPPIVDCIIITGDQLARVAVNGIPRTDQWIELR